MLAKILIKILSAKPVKRLAFKFFAYRFIAGEKMEDALRETKKLNQKSITAIINYLGEKVKTPIEADKNKDVYCRLVREIALKKINTRISVKPSQLGLEINDNLYYNLFVIGMLCSQYDIPMEIDMEEFYLIGKTVENSIKLKSALPNLRLRQCLQISAKRSSDDIKKLTDACINVRLCKGAYKIPPTESIPQSYVPYRIIAYADAFPSFIEVATHDKKILSHLKKGIGVQLLKGFFEKKREKIAKKNPVAVYIPFGENWIPYGIRRLFYLIKNWRKIYE